MQKDEIISKGLEDLCDYFRRSINPNVLSIYYDVFYQYNTIVIQDAFREIIDHGERFPKIKDIKLILQNIAGDNATIRYDPEEDQRFPVGLMWNALVVLRDNGEDSFLKYCKSVYMPRQDIERVRCKYKRAYECPKIELEEAPF